MRVWADILDCTDAEIAVLADVMERSGLELVGPRAARALPDGRYRCGDVVIEIESHFFGDNRSLTGDEDVLRLLLDAAGLSRIPLNQFYPLPDSGGEATS